MKIRQGEPTRYGIMLERDDHHDLAYTDWQKQFGILKMDGDFTIHELKALVEFLEEAVR